jgi:bifunctional non-homologous end joining protein LigD
VRRERAEVTARERPASKSAAPKRASVRGTQLPANELSQVEGIVITHPERLLFADSPLTKLDLARYLSAIWPHLEPHLRDRPLAFLRCPQGSRSACFFQKHWPGELAGVVPVDVSEPGEHDPPQTRIESAAGAVALAQNGVIELHLWGARAAALERPDRLVFDLDPGPGVAWRSVVEGARLLRSLLADLGLESFPLLSGGKGLHLVVPIVPEHDWPTVKAFAGAIAAALAANEPERYLAQATKRLRGGRIFVDYLRNGRGATAIAPYSPRARARAPVATPVSWDEIARSSPDRFTMATLPRRLNALKRDPWEGYEDLAQSLSEKALARAGVERTPAARKPAPALRRGRTRRK